MNDSAWRPISRPKRSAVGPGLVASPFVRLARVHAVGAASDAAVAVALAGSIFFSISPDAARWRVALYLLVTMAPFAVVTPLIGPAIDRLAGGRRAMIVATTIGRLVVAFLMIRHIETLWLFPEAFTMLVLQKGYAVAKSAVVPRYVRSETELVDANSRLSLVAAVVGMAGAALAGGFSLIGGPPWAAAVAMVGYLAATVLAFRLPKVPVATSPARELEKAELRGVMILLSASAMAVLRGAVGFVTFLLAFEFRGGSDGLDVAEEGAAVAGATATTRGIDITGDPAAPVWHFGVVIAAAGLGAVFGARLAPRLRKRLSEESMLLGVLVAVATAALATALTGGLFGATLLSLGVSTGAGAGKLAFDSLVQRDAPDANHGRSFARFEARFQIAWVLGAILPAVVPIGVTVGGTIVAIAVASALVSYLLGRTGRKLPRVPLRLPGRGRRPTTADLGPADAPDTGAGDDELTDDELRPSQPAAPAGTSELAALAPDDPTVALAAPGSSDPPASRTEPAAPPWWADPSTPVVSSVEGVEVDERSWPAPTDDQVRDDADG